MAGRQGGRFNRIEQFRSSILLMAQPNCDRCGELVAGDQVVCGYEIHRVDRMGQLHWVVGHEVALHARCLPSDAYLYAVPAGAARCGFTDDRWVCIREPHADDPNHLFFEQVLAPGGPRAGALRIA
jgi:hypothetical protein